MKLIFLLSFFFIFKLNYAQEKFKKYFVLDFQQSVETYSPLERIYILKNYEVSFKDIKDSLIECQGIIKGSNNLDQIDKYIYYFKNYRGDIDYEVFFEKLSAEFILYKKAKKEKKIFVKNNKYKVGQAWSENGDELLISGTGEQIQLRENQEKHINQYQDSVLVNSYKIRPLKKDTIYSLFDKIAEPKNGFDEFYKKIQKLKLPSKYNGKTIVAKLKFNVNKNGKLEEIISLRKEYDKVDEYIIKYVESLSDWNPAMFNGKPVKSQFTLPIKIMYN